MEGEGGRKIAEESKEGRQERKPLHFLHEKEAHAYTTKVVVVSSNQNAWRYATLIVIT